MDIEEVASSTPEKIITTKVEIVMKFQIKDCEEILRFLT